MWTSRLSHQLKYENELNFMILCLRHIQNDAHRFKKNFFFFFFSFSWWLFSFHSLLAYFFFIFYSIHWPFRMNREHDKDVCLYLNFYCAHTAGHGEMRMLQWTWKYSFTKKFQGLAFALLWTICLCIQFDCILFLYKPCSFILLNLKIG